MSAYAANERRQAIIEALNIRRHETLDNLAHEFGVSKRTIRYDIEALTGSYPIITTTGPKGGYSLMDGWYLSRHYLTQEQQELLSRLQFSLQGKNLDVLKGILSEFGDPRYKTAS